MEAGLGEGPQGAVVVHRRRKAGDPHATRAQFNQKLRQRRDSHTAADDIRLANQDVEVDEVRGQILQPDGRAFVRPRRLSADKPDGPAVQMNHRRGPSGMLLHFSERGIWVPHQRMTWG